MPTPSDPRLPDPSLPDHDPGGDATWNLVEAPGAGWIPDTVPAVPARGVAPDAARPSLTTMITPPHRGGVRRSGANRGEASLAAARLGSCRCPRTR